MGLRDEITTMQANPNPQLPSTSPKDNSTMGKARAWVNTSTDFYANHWVEICLAIALLSVIVVMITPD